MLSYCKRVVFIGFMSIVPCFSYAQISAEQETAIKTAITAVNDEMVLAAKSLNAEKLFEFFVEDENVRIIQDGKLQSLDEAMAATKAGFVGVEAIEYRFSNQHIQVISPEIALLVADGSSVFHLKDGREFSVHFAQSILFKRENEIWRMLHAHRSFPSNR